MERCQCCRGSRPSVFLRSVFHDGSEAWSAFVCPPCLRWLRENVAAARDGEPRLIAAPSANGNELLSDDQCRLCRCMTGEPLLRLECLLEGGGRLPFPAMRLCVACDTWLSSIARDGRSPRNLASRQVDGDYGNWLYPNLRSLSVAVDIADRQARDVVLTSCARMSVPAAPVKEIDAPSVIFREVPGAAAGCCGTNRGAPLVLLARLGARRELRDALGPRVADWLTMPVTPHQVAAALTRVLLAEGQPREWDCRTGLPVLAALNPVPPALIVAPAPRTDLLELAWLLRRFSRGYDTLGVHHGQVLVIPRAPRSRLPAIARRLRAVLGGRAKLTPIGPVIYEPRLRASG